MNQEHKKILKDAAALEDAVYKMRDDIRTQSLRHYKKSFEDEGFTYNSLWKWRDRKRETERTRGKKILTGTGKLKRSLIGKVRSGKTFFEYVVTSPLIYARIHNEGLMGNAFGHQFKMPKRQFVGYSRVLDLRLQRFFDMRIRKIFKR